MSTKTCPQCQTALPQAAKFCLSCGAPQSALVVAERREPVSRGGRSRPPEMVRVVDDDDQIVDGRFRVLERKFGKKTGEVLWIFPDNSERLAADGEVFALYREGKPYYKARVKREGFCGIGKPRRWIVHFKGVAPGIYYLVEEGYYIDHSDPCRRFVTVEAGEVTEIDDSEGSYIPIQ